MEYFQQKMRGYLGEILVNLRMKTTILKVRDSKMERIDRIRIVKKKFLLKQIIMRQKHNIW